LLLAALLATFGTLGLVALLPWLLLALLALGRLLSGLLLGRTLGRLLALRGLLALGLTARFFEAAVEGVLLHVEDFFELALEVIEDGGEVEAVELLAALLAKLLEEVAEALHAVAHGVAHAALEEVAEGVLEVAEVHEVIGEVIEDVFGLEGRDFLGAIPHGVAVAQGHGILRGARGTPDRVRVAESGRVVRREAG